MAGRKKILISEDEKEMMESYLQDNIAEALKIGGVSQQKYAKKFSDASDHLMNGCVASYVRDAAWINRFAEIPENAKGLISLFQDNAFSAHDAIVAALDNPQLFMQPYEETARRVEACKTRLCCPSLDMEEKEIFPFHVDNPRTLSYSPETVERTFKMNMILLESPFVAFRHDSLGLNFRRQRVDLLKGQFGSSVSNILLRMAAAELSFLAPSKFNVTRNNYTSFYVDTSNSFHKAARKFFETNMVQSLGFTGKGNVMDVPSELMTITAQRKKSYGLKADREIFIDHCVSLFDKMPRATGPRAWPIPVFVLINDHGAKDLPKTPEESRMARTNMVLGGLLKNYHLAVFPGF